MADELPSTRGLSEARLADLEKIAEYFETQSWDESWPADIILALARVKYPALAPFTLLETRGTAQKRHITEAEATEYGELYYLMDVRDRDGNKLPSE